MLPLPQEPWSIRKILSHLVAAQQDYLSMLTLPPGTWPEFEALEANAEKALEANAENSGAGLLAWALDEGGQEQEGWIQASDGYTFEPWVVLVQAIHHANDHRSQISDIMRALGLEPPGLSGWGYGEALEALMPPPDSSTA